MALFFALFGHFLAIFKDLTEAYLVLTSGREVEVSREVEKSRSREVEKSRSQEVEKSSKLRSREVEKSSKSSKSK